jgi:RHS repeat-associated protein
MAAVHPGSGAGYFQHADWLGSSRFAQDGSGNVTYDQMYAPFGEPYDETASTNRDFTGHTEDTAPGLYDFLFRQQSQSQGRWLVPDPAGLAAADITNPQTWNRYAYVGNNPLNAVDPKGLYKGINIFIPTFLPGVLGGGEDCGLGECGSFGSGFGGVIVDGVPEGGTSVLGGNSMAACPNNVCNGFTDSGEYFQFVAGAGGASGYIRFSDIQQGINEGNGTFYSDQQWQSYIAQTFASKIFAQFNRLLGNLPPGGALPDGMQGEYVDGGNANFTYTCSDWTQCGPGRYPDGVHVECAGGGFGCTSGALVAHDDTASPFIGTSVFSNFSPMNFLIHVSSDLIGGNSVYYVLP